MGETVIGPTATAFPVRTLPALLQIKQRWSDSWAFAPFLGFTGGTVNAAGADLDSCQISRRYGIVKEPFESSFSTKTPWNLLGWWVRLRFYGTQGWQTVFTGQIGTETRDAHGSAAHGESGKQTFTAYGPQQILRKTHISESWHQKSPNTFDAVASKLGWMPQINDAPGTGIPGNATSSDFGTESTKIYGKDALWTHRTYLEYVLKNFVQTADGPTWTIGGQDDLLSEMSDTIALGMKITASELIRKLIPTTLGIDYKIVSTDAGFEIFVYALHALEYSFAGATLPQNPNTVIVDSSETTDNLRTYVEQSSDQCYRTVRIIGKRVVVCRSVGPVSGWQHLFAKWAPADETDYKEGTGDPSETGDQHDLVRQSDRFDSVYQALGTHPDTHPYVLPDITPYGQLGPWASGETWQTQLRGTLDWTPLRASVDYTTSPPTDANPDHDAELLPPAVYVSHVDPFNAFANWTAYTPAEKFGIGVRAPRSDWGVLLTSQPNHALAANRFDGANPTAQPPLYDYTQLRATIAFESDQRLTLEYTAPDVGGSELPPPGDGVMIIERPDAQMWVLAPNTMVGIDDVHQPKYSPTTAEVLRNDATRLAFTMAGAIARYTVPRARARITIKGLLPWTSLLGQILTVIDDGGTLQTIQAPITSVTWRAGNNPTTVIGTGFAK